MIRVGFVLNVSDSGWMGGVNYYLNLLRAVAGSSRIELVILTGGQVPSAILSDLPQVEVIRNAIVDPSSKLYLARKVAMRLFGRDYLMERFLQSHHVDVLSHSGHLGPRATLPTIGWIPDFQHIRLPEFFTAAERRARNKSYARSADASTRIILSSEDARRDFESFRPVAKDKARVLHFVSGIGDVEGGIEPHESLMKRYNIDGPYFLLPNQFWVHKNHAVVIEALKLSRARGRPLHVVATGHTWDYRNPAHFESLMKMVQDVGCQGSFQVLGLVPYADLAALMHHSVAIINPSLFEGWSTTVEEAKSLGKTVILSDIPVHREQAPKYGSYFDPRSPETLADRMIEVLDIYSPAEELTRQKHAERDLTQRTGGFAASFEEIVLEVSRERLGRKVLPKYFDLTEAGKTDDER